MVVEAADIEVAAVVVVEAVADIEVAAVAGFGHCLHYCRYYLRFQALLVDIDIVQLVCPPEDDHRRGGCLPDLECNNDPPPLASTYKLFPYLGREREREKESCE